MPRPRGRRATTKPGWRPAAAPTSLPSTHRSEWPSAGSARSGYRTRICTMVGFAVIDPPVGSGGSLVGVVVFGLLVAAAFTALGRAARRSGVLLAVATGAVLRLAIM